jgi:membrane protein implicated in regulation of membrane protease activity
MDFSASTGWWVLAGLMVAAELASGTFYLLMLALGAAAAALAAHAGLGFTPQLLVAAVVGGGAVAAWHVKRTRQPSPPAEANRDINLDVGEHLNVAAWGPGGTARVRYRGTDWDARWAGSGAPQPGAHVIRAVEGSQLVLDRA